MRTITRLPFIACTGFASTNFLCFAMTGSEFSFVAGITAVCGAIAQALKN